MCMSSIAHPVPVYMYTRACACTHIHVHVLYIYMSFTNCCTDSSMCTCAHVKSIELCKLWKPTWRVTNNRIHICFPLHASHKNIIRLQFMHRFTVLYSMQFSEILMDSYADLHVCVHYTCSLASVLIVTITATMVCLLPMCTCVYSGTCTCTCMCMCTMHTKGLSIISCDCTCCRNLIISMHSFMYIQWRIYGGFLGFHGTPFGLSLYSTKKYWWQAKWNPPAWVKN